MGSDGTMGLRAIKEKAGVVLVQEPATAKFDGMPRSAIDAGLADIVAPVDELPGRIIAYLQRTPLIVKPKKHRPKQSNSFFNCKLSCFTHLMKQVYYSKNDE